MPVTGVINLDMVARGNLPRGNYLANDAQETDSDA
jgi:hypothetical protein